MRINSHCMRDATCTCLQCNTDNASLATPAPRTAPSAIKSSNFAKCFHAARRDTQRERCGMTSVLSKLARTRGGVRPHWGITVIPTCGAAPAPVMPQVRRTWGRAESREKPHVRPSPLDLLGSQKLATVSAENCEENLPFVQKVGGNHREGGRPLDLLCARRRSAFSRGESRTQGGQRKVYTTTDKRSRCT